MLITWKEDSSVATISHSRTLPTSSRNLTSSSTSDSNTSLPISNQSNNEVHIAFHSSKENLNNNLLKPPSQITSKVDISHKLPAVISLHQHMKKNKCNSSKVSQRSSNLFKSFHKHFARKKTSFYNSWTKITNPDVLEASCVKIQVPGLEQNRSASLPLLNKPISQSGCNSQESP